MSRDVGDWEVGIVGCPATVSPYSYTIAVQESSLSSALRDVALPVVDYFYICTSYCKAVTSMKPTLQAQPTRVGV